jgi:ATP-dependent phosphofructokinase / diphosphate-dependent phosphofructokinase
LVVAQSYAGDNLGPRAWSCISAARLGYLVRSGDPDALDSIVPMAFGNLALDLILKKQYGRLVSIHKGFYDSVPITSVTSEKKVVDVKKYYNADRLRPIYDFDGAPLFIMTSD